MIYNPTEISNLRCWYDATDASTITKDAGNLVSQWNDKSGNGYNLTQGTGANQPVCTGLPVINSKSAALLFDGANDCLDNANVTYSNAAVSVAICFIPRSVAASATDVRCICASKNSGNSAGWAFVESNGYNAVVNEYTCDENEYYNGAANAYGSGYAFGIASRQEYRFIQYDAYVHVITFPAHTSTNGIHLGAFNTGALRFYGESYICELAVYNKTLSAEEITNITNYMLRKHNFNFATRVQIPAGTSDAEENVATTVVTVVSLGMQMNYTGTTKQLCGFRFTPINIPRSAYIHKAYLRFIARVAAVGTSPTLTIKGENTDNSTIFTTTNADISGRSLTTASIAYASIAAWNAAREYLSPDVSSIIQEIINRPGWVPNNAMTFIVSGTTDAGNPVRDATAYDGAAADAAYLELLWSEYVPAMMDHAVGRGVNRGVGCGIM